MDAKKAKVEKDLAQENKAAERLAAKVRNEKVGAKPGREAGKKDRGQKAIDAGVDGDAKGVPAKPKEKPPKKEKPAKGEVILKSQFDHPLTSQGGIIDANLEAGREVILKKLMEFAQKDEGWAKGRLAGHLKHLAESHKAKIALEPPKEKKEKGEGK